MKNLTSTISSFLIHLEKERGYSPHTIEAYRRDLTQFNSFIKIEEIKLALSKESIRSFIYHLGDLKLSPKTLSRKRATLRSICNYAIGEKLIECNPFKSIAQIKLPKPLPKLIQKSETRDLLNLSTDVPIRDRAIVEILYGSGIRLSELYDATLGDLNRGKLIIKVRGKGGKERFSPLTSHSMKLFEDYLKECGRAWISSEPLFTNRKGEALSKRQIQRIVEKTVGLISSSEKRSPHVLRHTYASQMLEAGADIRVLKELLGHNSLASTQIYTHTTKDNLKRAYKQAHPRSGQ